MQQLIERLDDAAIAMRADTNLTIAAWNHRTEQLFHRAAEDAIGRPSIEAAPSADPRQRAQRTADTRRDGWWHGRSTLLTSLAELIVVETFCVLVRTWCGALEYVSILRPIQPQFTKTSFSIPITPDLGLGLLADVGSKAVASVSEIRRLGPESTAEQVGAKLTAAREAADLSKRRLSKLAQVHEWQLRQWESGEHIVTPGNLAKLIPYIGGTIEYYLFEEHE